MSNFKNPIVVVKEMSTKNKILLGIGTVTIIGLIAGVLYYLLHDNDDMYLGDDYTYEEKEDSFE